ncbi:MAG: aspartyl protease family protein, partial [Acidimicrobiales bacterium]
MPPHPNPSRVTCSGRTGVPATPTQVPLHVERADATIRALISVCVDEKGPFPFVLDTGAPRTTFDTHFLDDVHSSLAGPAMILRQPGCSTVVLDASVDRWSVGSIALAAQPVAVVRMPGFGLRGQPEGVLGSDVLSRFGTVRIDYRAQQLTVSGPEGPTSAMGRSVG